MFRVANPTDLAGLLRFAAQATPNLAHPGHELGADARRVWVSRAAVSSWFPKRGRTVQPLILAKGRELRGLVVLRGLRGMATWEVDQLLVGTESRHTSAELLARADVSLVRTGAERIILRLAEDDDAVGSAYEAGYRRYKEESIFCTSSTRTLGGALPLPLDVAAHSKIPEDEYSLFRLYTAANPVFIRTAEGLTFREWNDTTSVRSQGMRNVKDTVFDSGGQPVAWLRTGVGSSGQSLVQAVFHPDRRTELIEPVLSLALVAAKGKPLAAVVSSNDDLVARMVEDAGLRYQGRFLNLIHHIRDRATENSFMPAPV